MGPGGQVEVGMKTGVPLKNVIEIVQLGSHQNKVVQPSRQRSHNEESTD